MNELNTNPILSAIMAALNAHIDARIAAALAAQPKQETEVNVDKENLRALVAPMVGSLVEDAVTQAMEEHTEAYDHDGYDSMVNTVDDLPDFSNYDELITEDDLDGKVEKAVEAIDLDDMVKEAIDNYDFDDKIRESVGNLTFEVSVS